MNELVLRNSRGRYMILLLLDVGFVAAGIFILWGGGPAWVGWMSIVFFGSGIPLFLWRFFESRPRLVINDRGILDATLGVGLIRWEDVGGAYICSIHHNDFICLHVRRPEQYLARLSPTRRAMAAANEALGFTALAVNLSGVAADTTQVYELILKQCAVHGGGAVTVAPPRALRGPPLRLLGHTPPEGVDRK